MVSLAFDTDAPPEQPPAGCADPLLWRVSRALYEEHRWEPGDRCMCGDRYPCNRARLAERGLVTSCTRRRRGPERPGVEDPGDDSRAAAAITQPG
jgi:hypothetical protein